MVPHSSTLAWKIPWMEGPGRLQSMGSLRVGHDWEASLSLFTFMHWRRKWQPTPVFLPWESQGRGSLAGCRLWGLTESDTTEATWQQQRLEAVVPQKLLYHKQTPEGARDYERLKKKPGNLSNWEMTLKNPENCQSPKDASEAPWISSSTEQNIALCKNSLQRLRMADFFQIHTTQKKKEKFKRHIKKQGHMAKSKR